MQGKKKLNIYIYIYRERERERERERTFCVWKNRKLCMEWEREWQIYSKRVWIRTEKNKERWRERERMILR